MRSPGKKAALPFEFRLRCDEGKHQALGLALWLSLLSTALCLLLAYPLAMILANRNVNQTSFIVLIFILPM